MLPPCTRRPIESMEFEIKEANNLAEFSKTLEDLGLMMDIIKKEPIRNERNLALKYAEGAKLASSKMTLNVKNAKNWQPYCTKKPIKFNVQGFAYIGVTLS
jgi:hypothetical protein